MLYDLERFKNDFQQPYKKATIDKMIEKKRMISFVLESTIAREFNKPVRELMHFCDFLAAIGFMRYVSKYRFELNPEYVPKNQR